MTISLQSPRFQGKFIWKSQDLKSQERERIQQYVQRDMRFRKEDSFRKLHADSPEPGDVTIEIADPRPGDRREVHREILDFATDLGVPVTFVPDKPVTEAELNASADRLAKEFQRVLARIRPDGGVFPGFTPKVIAHPDRLEIQTSERGEYSYVESALDVLNERFDNKLHVQSFGEHPRKAYRVSLLTTGPITPDDYAQQIREIETQFSTEFQKIMAPRIRKEPFKPAVFPSQGRLAVEYRNEDEGFWVKRAFDELRRDGVLKRGTVDYGFATGSQYEFEYHPVGTRYNSDGTDPPRPWVD